MPSVISGDANVSATEFGFLDGVTSALQSQIDSKLALAGGKILQIVRDTDTTQRSTTSTTFVDVTGLSVTITPQKSDSAVLLIVQVNAIITRASNNPGYAFFQITDNSNNAISGAERLDFGGQLTGTINFRNALTMIARATPATTSAVTYKTRFRTDSSDVTLVVDNAINTAEMYAIEVSA